jgi:hypothetical protein
MSILGNNAVLRADYVDLQTVGHPQWKLELQERNEKWDRFLHACVNDLGVAAYLMMHGYSLAGKRDRSIYFECQSQNELDDLQTLVMDYQPPNEFCTFDNCLMWLKKNEFLDKSLSVLRLTNSWTI